MFVSLEHTQFTVVVFGQKMHCLRLRLYEVNHVHKPQA